MNPTRKRFPRWTIGILAIALGVAAYFAWMNLYYTKNHYSKAQLVPFLTADEVELFSLDPSCGDEEKDTFVADSTDFNSMKTPPGNLHGFPVLGSCKITAPDELAIVRNSISEIHYAGQRWNGDVTMCFLPRHCIRVHSGGTTFDFLICYQYSRAEIYRTDAEEGSISWSLHPKADGLNGLLKSHGIELPRMPQLSVF